MDRQEQHQGHGEGHGQEHAPEHEGDRPDGEVLLRVPEEADAAAFAEIFADPKVMMFIGDGSVRDLAYYQDFVRGQQEEHRREGFCLYTVVDPDGRVAGFVGAHRWNQPWGPTGEVEIGWRLGTEFWDRRLASRGARQVLEQLRRHGHESVVALVHAGNVGSIRIAERLGMVRAAEHDIPPASGQDGQDGPVRTALEFRRDLRA